MPETQGNEDGVGSEVPSAFLRKAVSVQREMLAMLPSTSIDPRLFALSVLEERDYQQASGSHLRVLDRPFVLLGGMPKRVSAPPEEEVLQKAFDRREVRRVDRDILERRIQLLQGQKEQLNRLLQNARSKAEVQSLNQSIETTSSQIEINQTHLGSVDHEFAQLSSFLGRQGL